MDLFLSWLVLGFLIGSATYFLEFTPKGQSYWLSIILGITGAIAGSIFSAVTGKGNQLLHFSHLFTTFYFAILIAALPKKLKPAIKF